MWNISTRQFPLTAILTLLYIWRAMNRKRHTQREIKDTQLGVRLESELLHKFADIAKSEERTLSQLARIAIREFVERRNTQVAA